MFAEEALSAAAAGFLTLAIILVWTGKSSNETVAKIWCHAAMDFLRTKFARVDDKIRAISYHEYEVFASGRKHLSHCLISLNLIPRQDLITGHLAPTLLRILNGSDPTAFGSFTTRDKMIVEFGIRFQTPQRYTFILGRKMRYKALATINEAMKSSVSKQEDLGSEIPPWLCIIGDSRKATQSILKFKPVQQFVSIAAAEKTTFISLHISDMLKSDRWPLDYHGVVRLEVAMKENSQNTNLIQGYLKAVMEIIDCLNSWTPDEEICRQVAKARTPIAKVLQKEQIESKKEEEQKQLKADQERQHQRLMRMSPAERQRFLDKKNKPKKKHMLVKV
eukprot:Gregarina_sp_Poly_1__11017@NODE_878_length_5897_cov_80_799828_g615_i1_p3_GENE_NODE_878_length_5897_cov_80_799828_g615_i1NODE_878_length_5897_cov_80_799828_g615_i1_p3_ORF_typecomplete_len334_score55_66DUF1682/PF07946_14/1_8e43DUF98/PF01947_16/0_083PH_RBD/PF12068_8/0_19_NODE_878_length_5897_cov_80_799828_g615_i121893190